MVDVISFSNGCGSLERLISVEVVEGVYIRLGMDELEVVGYGVAAEFEVEWDSGHGRRISENED